MIYKNRLVEVLLPLFDHLQLFFVFQIQRERLFRHPLDFLYNQCKILKRLQPSEYIKFTSVLKKFTNILD